MKKARKRRDSPTRTPVLLLSFVYAASMLFLYGLQGNAQDVTTQSRSAILWMVRRWSGSGGDLSHGWLIPLISVFLIWRQRHELAHTPRRRNRMGLFLVMLALLLHVVGVRAQLTRISLFSLVLLLWAIPLYHAGLHVARRLLFPCAYLIYCIPMSFLNDMTLPLRLLAGRTSAVLLRGFGVDAVSRGTAVYSMAAGGFNFDVADACSGLRSLLALTAVAAVYAYLSQPGRLRKWIVFTASVPIALTANIFRILTIALVAQRLGTERAMIVYHDYSGFLVFGSALLLLLAFGKGLDRLPAPRHPKRQGETPGPVLGSAPARPEALPRAAAWARHGFRPHLVILVLMLATAGLLPTLHGTSQLLGPTIRFALPSSAGPYRGESIFFCQDPACLQTFPEHMLEVNGMCPVCGGELGAWSLAERTLLPPDTRIARKEYADSQGRRLVASIVLSGVEQKSIHRPQQCLPAQGFTIEKRQVIRVPIGGRPDLQIMCLTIRPSGSHQGTYATFAYWFVGPQCETPYHLQRLLWMAVDRFLHGTAPQWAYISVSTELSGNPALQRESVRDLAAQLHAYIMEGTVSRHD